jgi:hypothetical protein
MISWECMGKGMYVEADPMQEEEEENRDSKIHSDIIL